MSPLKKTHLHKIFDNLDKNGDGLVSIDELMWLLERTGIYCKRDELELLVGKTAFDPFDFLFFYEALIIKGKNNMVQEKCEIQREDDDDDDEILERDLREAFRVFDLNGDGFICSEELQIALSRLGLWDENCRQDCTNMIGVYDTNSDGLMDFEEFKAMMLLA